MQDSKRVQISDQPLNRQNPLNRQYILNKIYPCHCTGWLNTLCHTSNQHFFEQKIWETAVRKQESDFLGGNKCRETGVCFFGGKTGVGKHVLGNRCLDIALGNRCRETGVLIPFGNRCRETGVLIPCGNRCQGNRCLDSIVTEH